MEHSESENRMGWWNEGGESHLNASHRKLRRQPVQFQYIMRDHEAKLGLSEEPWPQRSPSPEPLSPKAFDPSELNAIPEEKNSSEVTESKTEKENVNYMPSPWLEHPTTLRSFLLDNALNVRNLSIGENQKIDLESTDELWLPALQTISWHSQIDSDRDDSTMTNYSSDSEDTSSSTRSNNDKKDKRRQWAIHRILLAAPNLQIIRDFNFDTDIDIVLAAGKVPTIEKLIITDAINVDSLNEFIQGRPRVKFLQLLDAAKPTMVTRSRSMSSHLFGDNVEKLIAAVHNLLRSISDTLRVFEMSQYWINFDLKLPILEKLSQLTLGHSSDPWTKPSRLLPRHIDLDATFPHLSVLDLSHLECPWNFYWDLYFPRESHPPNFGATEGPSTSACARGYFSSVKTLVISDECTHFFMDKMETELCPNFTKLVVKSKGHDTLDFMFVKIFTYFQHLQWFQIQINLDPDSTSLGTSTLQNLDSAVTGLRVDSCQKLRDFGPGVWIGSGRGSGKAKGRGKSGGGNDGMDMETEEGILSCEMKKYLENARPAITNMIYLKHVEIILGHEVLETMARQMRSNMPTVPLLSFVSGRYGFSLMPQLRVYITFDHKCPWGHEVLKLFDPLTPYVTLKHRHDRGCSKDKNILVRHRALWPK